MLIKGALFKRLLKLLIKGFAKMVPPAQPKRANPGRIISKPNPGKLTSRCLVIKPSKNCKTRKITYTEMANGPTKTNPRTKYFMKLESIGIMIFRQK